MNETRNHSIAGLFVYLLLGLFAVMSLALVLLGIKTYAAASEKTRAHNTERILTNYVRTVLRSADGENEIYTEELNGLPVLTVRYTDDEETYYTRIYAFEGQLYEQFTSEEIEFEPGNGERLCACASFVPKVEGKLVTLVFTETTGAVQTVYVALKAGR